MGQEEEHKVRHRNCLRWVLTFFIGITRFLVDELDLAQSYLDQWIDFELSQFVVPATCPRYVLVFPSIHTHLTVLLHRCTKPNLFELSEYNRSKLLICMHACKCVWCRDCSRLVTVEAPHDCEDAALEELAGTRRWMRCPKPSELLIILLSLQVGPMFACRLSGYG